MSRMNKWKLEKTKVKVVFRLQFHATHIPLSGWDKLFISFIPADTGKVTAKTTKANARNGTCKWGDPIYETTRLLQDLKTKQYEDKLYKLVVAMGTSRSSVLGEATINLADYADASKPSVTVLPLHGSDSGTALHVTVQLLTSKTGFREFEQQRELRERGLHTDQNTSDDSSGRKVSSSEETVRDQINKVNSRVRFSDKPRDLASLGEGVGPTEEYADSAVGFDGSSNTSGSLYAEKQETSSNHEIDSLKSTASGDLVALSPSQSPQPDKTDQSDHHRFSPHGTTDWIHGYRSDCSVDNELATVNEENNRLRGSLEAAESSIQELKLEVSSLQSHANEIGNEAQLFAKQLAAEILSGEMLVKEVSILKSECSKLKDDLEQLKMSKVCPPVISREIVSHQNGATGFDLDVYQPEVGMLHCLNIPGLISHEPEALDATNVMNGKIFELLRELDESKAERDSLAKKMDQMECYYEALVQELEENQRQILRELQNLRNEHSTCVYTVSSAKAEMESMHRDLNEQILRLATENRDLDSLNKEFERRALTAEAAVKRARLNYSIAVEQLQKDLQLLSSQVLSMHESNENLIREAFVDSPPLCNNRVDSGEHASKHLRLTQKQQLGEDIHLDDLKRSLHLQEGLYRKVEQEFCELHVMNIYLDVVSTVLRETVIGANEEAKFTKQKINELELQLEISAESNQLLMQKLRIAVDEVHSLDAKCNGLDLENQNLKANLQTLIQENHLFAEKITELDSLVMQYRGFENRYEACAAENTELTYLLEKKTLEIGILQNNNFSLLDELKAVKTEFDELASGNEKLQNFVNFLQQKLQSLLSSCDKTGGLLVPLSRSESQDVTVILARLEDVQHNACDKILELVESNKRVIEERDSLKLTNVAAESEISQLKNKLEHEIRNIANKLDALANRFEINEFEERYTQQHTEHLADLDSFEVQLQEIASRNAGLARDIFALETVTSAELTKENQALMATLQAKNDESNKLESELKSLRESLESLHDEKRTLMACSQDKTQESAQLAEELKSLNKSLASSQDKAAEASKLALELDSLKRNLQSLDDENKALKIAAREKAGEFAELELEIKGVKESLVSLNAEKEALMLSLQEKDELALEINSLKESLHSLNVEKEALMLSLQEKGEASTEFALEISNLKDSLQLLNVEKEALMLSLQEKDELALEINNLKESLKSLNVEKEALMLSLQEKDELASEINSLQESLQSLNVEKEALLLSLQEKDEASAALTLEIDDLKESLQAFNVEKEALMLSLQEKDKASAEFALEINNLKESLRSLNAEKEALVLSLKEKDEASAELALEIKNLKESLQAFNVEKEALMLSLQEKDEASAELALEINNLKESLQSMNVEKEALMLSLQEKDEAPAELEINNLKESLQSFNVEKEALMLSIQEKDKATAELEAEINNLKESLHSLNVEKEALMLSLQEKDEASAEFALEINNLKEALQSFNVKKDALMLSLQEKDEASAELALEINNLKETLRSLNVEKEALMLSLQEKDEASTEKNLEGQLLHLQKSVSHLESEKLRVCNLLSSYEESLVIAPGLESELREMLEVLIATDVRLIFVKSQSEGIAEQTVFQLAELQKKHSDTETALNSCLASNKSLIEENEKLLTSRNFVRSELEAKRDTNAELDEKRNRDLNEDEIDNLILANEELEVKALVFKAKLDEKQAQIIAIQGYRDELKKQYNETTQKLAEQTMKTEEFKNLSIHLKELKDKDDKREPEASSSSRPVTMQESLRVAFIKEQYETKLQELKQQLSISKKHSEEMLWKLQDAIDEIENRKKSEACHLKKNEELGIEILDLEAELQQLLTDKRELTKAYDLMKAEMECSSISLECCKEEKQKLEASLQECNEEKSIIEAELARIKEILENSKSTVNREVQNDGSCIDYHCSSSNGDEINRTSVLVNVQAKEDHIASNGIRSPTKSIHSDMKQSGVINDHLRVESLMISMDNLSNELERMKNENSLLQDYDLEVKFPNLQSELLQLQKANEELGSMFPLFNEFSGSGNALERVLALEMELAEALQAKKRSSIHFQSSFLKQHSDEEAVFKSFRDINELIKDMLEIKGRYSSVEKELKEMHDRYSQLSLQFAEVEGERQKLMMTLKNVRASKKALQLNRSASASLGDHSV